MNWFHLVPLVAVPIIILIGCMVFWSPFLDVITMSMPTVSFLAHRDSGILYLQNAFL